MKFCRFVVLDNSKTQPAIPVFGIIEDDKVIETSGPPWHHWSRTSHTRPLSDVRLLAPVEPAKIVCVGRNYAAHAAELGNELPKEPLIFLKPSSSIIGHGDPILLPRYSQKVEHEGEIAMVMSRRCSHLQDSDDALAHVLGYTCVNDVTARDLQQADVQFTRAKSFDTFCPVGPHIETDLDPSNLLVETYVNGGRRQSGSTSLMTYTCAFLIRWISRMMTLHPGDLISTGTPAGVGQLVAGDTVEVRVTGIGVLRNPVHPPQA
jgi:2-keto-4-pentenoate hydratase/2-oxohepta-3-ene-1,7-dioic acid hydratase in catechol pathway